MPDYSHQGSMGGWSGDGGEDSPKDWNDPVDGGSKSHGEGGGGRQTRDVRDPRLSIAALTNTTDPATVEHGRIVEILSNGPIEGLVLPDGDIKKALQSVYFDNVQIQNSDGSWNYDGVYLAMVRGTKTQTYIQGFGGLEYEDVSSNREIKQASPVTVSITDTSAHAARIKVSVPALFDGENGTRVNFKIELQAAGEPVNNGWNVIYGPAARAVPANSKLNTLGLSIDGTAKTITRDEGDYITDGFWAGAQIKLGGFNNAANKKVFTVAAVTSKVITLASDDTPVTEGYANGCSMITVGCHASIIGEFSAKYVKGFMINFNGLKGPWNIRVTKITADTASTTVQRSLYFESVTTIRRVKQSYPLTTIVETMMDSRKIQRVPSRTYLIKGRILRVPTNYDPITRVYATSGPGTTGGVWDGTFKEAWTDNPAWVFFDMATNNLYGCGQALADSNIGISALYLIAQYCDQLVPDGKGGTEPRFRISANITNQQDAMKLLNTLASVFRGAAYYYGDKVFPTHDAPAASVGLFTASNVKDGKFSYTSTSKRARHTAAVVTWADPANRFAKTQEYVEDAAGVARYGLNILEFTSFGCIYQGQARRDGLWAIATELMSTEVVTFETADEGILLRPNDIFTVSDGARWGKRMGGRIVAADLSMVDIDDASLASQVEADLASGHTFTLTVKLPNGTLETRNVLDVIPGTVTLRTVEAYSAIPQVEGQWILTDVGISFPIDYRLISVDESESDGATVYKITGLLYQPSKYDVVEQGLTIRPFAYPAQYFAEAPSNVSASELVKLYGSVYGTQLRVVCDPIAKADYYEAVYSKDNGPWEKLSQGASSVFTLDNAPLGAYRIRMAAHYPNGRLSPYVDLEYTVKGTDGLEAPDAPTNLAAFVQGSQLYLSWMAPANDTFGVLTYEVRWGQTWESGQLVGRTSATTILLPSDGVYWVAAMQFKKYSTPVSLIVGSVDFQRNVVESFDEKALNWPGTKTAGMSSDPVIGLYLSSIALFEDATGNFDDAAGLFDYYGGVVLEGTYTPPASHQVDIGQAALCTITCRYNLTAVSTSDSFDDIPDIDAWPDIDGSVGNTATILIELRTSQDGTTWGAWMPYAPGQYMLRKVEYRITLKTIDPQVYPALSAFEITIDMPDRTEQAQGEAISAAGKTVTFAKKFQEKPVTHITMIDAALGSYYKLTGESTTGFTVTLYNASNVAIAGTINRSSRGY